MKISVSLSDDDVAFLDAEQASGAFESRSAAVAAAIALYRRRDLVAAYEGAFEEWGSGPDADGWSSTDLDGIR